MKLTIIAIGSRGDVQPCVALGRRLTDVGYQVRLVTMEGFKSLVENHGLEFFPVEGDARALVNEMMPQHRKANSLNLLQMYRSMMRTFGAITESYHKAFSDETLFDSDAILSQLPGGFYGYDLAEYLQVPYIALSVIPQEMTGAWALSLLPNRFSLGAWYNRLTYHLGRQLAWRPFRKPINKFRQQLGLTPASFWWGNMRRMVRECVPVMQGFSPHVVPTQSEWGEHVHTTGYWTLDEPEWEPSEELSVFLESGDSPVFVGFGSMPVSEPEQTTSLILKALEQCGKRCVLHSGWANLGAADLPDTVFPLDYAPYAWLFPRISAVIHHGGSGTTGLALRSGVPSMVIPFMADQPFWGERTHALGVGPKPIPFSKLTVENLANAIQMATSSETMREKAQALSQKIQQEDGLAEAVKWVQHYLA